MMGREVDPIWVLDWRGVSRTMTIYVGGDSEDDAAVGDGEENADDAGDFFFRDTRLARMRACRSSRCSETTAAITGRVKQCRDCAHPDT